MRKILTTALLLGGASLLGATVAAAAEDLPPGPLGPKARSAVGEYRTASMTALNKLSAMVEKTREGEEHLGAQWEGVCNDVLRKLEALKKNGHVEAPLQKWYEAELEAWKRVRGIGLDMMDLHYKMASMLEEIEEDVAISKAFHRDFRERLAKLDALASKNENAISEIDQKAGLDDFAALQGPLGKLNEVLPHLQQHGQTVSRLISIFRDKRFRFIKERDLAGPYRDRLGSLKSKAIDPDGKGVFAEYEKDWEEILFRTHQRYGEAVVEWKKVNAWVDKKEFRAALKASASMLLKLNEMTVMGLPLPVLSPNFEEKLGDWCLKVREAVVKAVDKVRGQTWAKLEAQILSAEEERRMVQVELDQAIEANLEAARKRFHEAETKIEKELEQLAKQLAAVDRKALGSKVPDVVSEERRLGQQIKDKNREIEKIRAYTMDDWLPTQNEKAYDEYRRKLKAIDERMRKLEGQKKAAKG
jgi:hypothetical protein